MQPVEAIFRSLLLVLLDNASSEFTFLVRFFSATMDRSPKGPSVARSNSGVNLGTASPSGRSIPLSRKDSMLSVASSGLGGAESSDGLGIDARGLDSISDAGTATPPVGMARRRSSAATSMPSKETLRLLETIWKRAMETAVEYCQVSGILLIAISQG
jgi:hypothetical protein